MFAVAGRQKLGQFLGNSMSTSPSALDRSPEWFWNLRKQDWLLGLLLAMAVFCAYQPVWHAGFIWDDEAHVTRPELCSLGGLARIWFQLGATQQYYPLMHSVFWVEHRLWGYSALGYHLVNVLLHVVVALLLVKILRQLKIPGAWLAAAIFALHPVQVESVAWISELKNTLSGVFYLGAALIYLEFDRSRNRGKWVLALGLFAAGLMSKTVIATLPAALLVVFWWQRGKISWKQDVLPLIPFFIMGMGVGLFTAWVERKFVIGAEVSEFNFSLVERLLIAGRVIWFYLGKLFWPVNLAFVYPRWDVSQGVWWQYLFPAAVLLLLGMLAGWHRRWRGPLAGLLFFSGTLFPALGFFNVYPFLYSFVADHFQYLAGIGPIALMAGGITAAMGFWGKGKCFLQPAFCGALLLTLGILTWRQCGMYADNETLWRATIARNPDSFLAHNDLGLLLSQKGQMDEALEHYQKALEIKPQYVPAHYNLGNAFLQRGQWNEAIACFQKALEINPNVSRVWYNLGNAFLRSGRVEKAIVSYQETLKIRPDFWEGYNNLGNALGQAGRTDEAIAAYLKALEISPDNAGIYNNLGNALMRNGRLDEAIANFQKVLAIRPDFAEAQNSLGYGAWVLATSPEASVRNGIKAVKLAEQVNRFSQGVNPLFLGTLAAAYAETGRFPEAVDTAQHAQQLAVAQNNTRLVNVLQQQIGFYKTGSPFRDTHQIPNGQNRIGPENGK
jgi:tetratricopeptide (TPR) repeat protein